MIFLKIFKTKIPSLSQLFLSFAHSLNSLNSFTLFIALFIARSLKMSIFSNPQMLASSLKKTKMCRTRMEGIVCTRSNCTFAHSLDELRLPMCANGSRCHNTSCRFVHPQETALEYVKRTGYMWPRDIEIPELKHVPPPSPELKNFPPLNSDENYILSLSNKLKQQEEEKDMGLVIGVDSLESLIQDVKMQDETEDFEPVVNVSFYAVEIIFPSDQAYLPFKDFLMNINATVTFFQDSTIHCIVSTNNFSPIVGALMAMQIPFKTVSN